MFRINDNDDGSRVVYCSETGRRLCTIPKKRDKPLAIGRPMPRAVDPHPSTAVVVNSQYLQNGYRPMQCNIMPLPWIDNDLPTEAVVADKCEFDADKNLELDQDINEECISKEEFLQIFQLCAKSSAENSKWKELREKLPTRSISRPLKRDINVPDRFVSELPNKTYEDIDLSSPLALTWLKDMPEGQKRLLNDNSKSMCIKRYETFCKFAIGSPCVLGTASPYSMRCREIKKYSVTFKPMKVGNSCHKYCFTKQDRLERKKALRAGLNKRSRDLKKTLSGNVFKVHLQRLGQEEIKKWTTRSSTTVPFVNVKTEYPYSASKGKEMLKIKQNPSSSARKSVVVTRNSIISTRNSLKTPKMKTDIALNMSLRVDIKNVLEQLELKQGSMYVRGTTIKVRIPTELSNYLSQNNMAPFANVVKYSQLGLQDHAYHRVAPREVEVCPTVTKWSRGSSSQVKRLRVTTLKNGLNKKQKVNSDASPSNVQVIDLCSEDDEKIVPTTPLPSTQSSSKFTYVFRCFGCDSSNTYKTKTTATNAVKEHMVIYHAVAEPKAFLNIHINKASKVLLIEAFPGYKELNSV